ncbi:MAG: hypothetical protein WCR95_06435 [Eubacteriales bacterium]
MLSKSAETFAKSLGLRVAENNAYGIYNGYFLTVYEKKAKKTIVISCLTGLSDAGKANDEREDDFDEVESSDASLSPSGNNSLYLNIIDGVRKAVELYPISDYSVDENGVTAVTSAPLTTLRELTDYLIKTLREVSAPGAGFCSGCGRKFKPGEKRKIVTFTGGHGEEKKLFCDSCALDAAEERSPATEKARSELNHKNGIVASLIASVLAASAYTLLFFLLGLNGRSDILKFFACFFAVIIGGAAFFTYRAVVKRVNPRGLAAVLIVSGFLVLVGHILACTAGTAKYLKENFNISYSTFGKTFSNYISLQFTDSKNFTFLALGFALALCSAAAAVLLLYGSAKKRDSESDNVKVTIQTVN